MTKVSKYKSWVKELILELMRSQQSAFRGECSIFFYRVIIQVEPERRHRRGLGKNKVSYIHRS